MGTRAQNVDQKNNSEEKRPAYLTEERLEVTYNYISLKDLDQDN